MRPHVLCLALVTTAALAACGHDRAAPVKSAEIAPERDRPPPRWPKRARCAPAAANCTAARGTVLYVERVDPDGDGDAHLVLASADSVTGPGITAIDIERSLRPHPLPELGDRVSAAGPVYRGSYGQRQIQATELHVARR